jgi:predicted membrane protein (TIGR00267 family)
LKHRISDLLQQFHQYGKLANVAEIARRYFAMNAFDGALTMIGVLMGNFTAGVDTPRIVVSTGLATSVAMGISGLWGAYLTEAAERKREITEISEQVLIDLHDTRIGKASRFAVAVVAVVDGISPALAALIILSPFFIADLFGQIQFVYFSALGMALLSLFALGAFLGTVSKENVFLYGLRTVVAGLVSIGISYLLGAPGE